MDQEDILPMLIEYLRGNVGTYESEIVFENVDKELALPLGSTYEHLLAAARAAQKVIIYRDANHAFLRDAYEDRPPTIEQMLSV